MEQTLGKRISANRKRLGLTQDKLAEQLGVTAQAVSKWENDQACPDIATLPKLAAIFGVTTDALLGIEKETVHEAEIVSDEEGTASDGRHTPEGKWEFQWNGPRRSSLGFALMILLVGGLLLAGGILGWEVSLWDLLWPSAILVFGLMGLVPGFPFFRIVCTLAGAYCLLDEIGFLTGKLPAKLIFPIILLILGLSLLADTFRKNRKPVFRATRNGGGSKKDKRKCECVNGEDSFQCNLCFGENHHHVTAPVLRDGDANLSFGELTVDLLGCQKIAEDCTIQANCCFGELRFLVPSRFAVQHSSGTAFASINIVGQPDPEPDAVICLDASVSFGEITIQYV